MNCIICHSMVNQNFMSQNGSSTQWILPGNDEGDVIERIIEPTIDGFHGAWLHFRRAKVGVWV